MASNYLTYSGIDFDALHPTVEMISIKDIAYALSRTSRFCGHARVEGGAGLYTVAQHSTFVADFCNLEDKLWGLLHDASEAYINDVTNPVKHSGCMDAYLDIEENLMNVICDKFGLPHEMPDSVREADLRMLVTEERQFMVPHDPWYPGVVPYGGEEYPVKIHVLTPRQAERKFKRYFHYLTKVLPKQLESGS